MTTPADKVWHVTGTINGRRIRESAKTSSREHAEPSAESSRATLEDRAYKKDAAVWAEAMTYYVEKRGNKQKAFLDPLLEHFGAMRLKDITPMVVSQYVTDHLSHLQPSSVKRAFYTPMNSVMRAATAPSFAR